MKALPPALACLLAAALAGCATPGAGGGGSFPFPQHRLSSYCYYPPACNDADVSAAWDKWKSTFVVASGNTLRVQRPESGNDTVSEGIGYGMIAAVYMNDKATFDGLWGYAQQKLDGNGLMNWHYTSGGAIASGGSGGATDGDEDIAF